MMKVWSLPFTTWTVTFTVSPLLTTSATGSHLYLSTSTFVGPLMTHGCVSTVPFVSMLPAASVVLLSVVFHSPATRKKSLVTGDGGAGRTSTRPVDTPARTIATIASIAAPYTKPFPTDVLMVVQTEVLSEIVIEKRLTPHLFGRPGSF